jgi:predicted nucleic acid-binding protein
MAQKKTVYLETSFISYLTSRPSTDLITAGHQAITRQWWEKRRHGFELFSSELVLLEAQRGDPAAVERRFAVLTDLVSLDVSPAAEHLAALLMTQHAVPEKASEDALHIAVASVNRIHYLLTWNCKHIANAECFDSIERVCTEQGYTSPILCTPEELLGVH